MRRPRPGHASPAPERPRGRPTRSRGGRPRPDRRAPHRASNPTPPRASSCRTAPLRNRGPRRGPPGRPRAPLVGAAPDPCLYSTAGIGNVTSARSVAATTRSGSSASSGGGAHSLIDRLAHRAAATGASWTERPTPRTSVGTVAAAARRAPGHERIPSAPGSIPHAVTSAGYTLKRNSTTSPFRSSEPGKGCPSGTSGDEDDVTTGGAEVAWVLVVLVQHLEQTLSRLLRLPCSA